MNFYNYDSWKLAASPELINPFEGMEGKWVEFRHRNSRGRVWEIRGVVEEAFGNEVTLRNDKTYLLEDIILD